MSETEKAPPDLSQLEVRQRGLVGEFWDFIIHNKAWWMTPIILVILAMVAFILFAESSPVLPFVYTVI
jgi:hypothetical protein